MPLKNSDIKFDFDDILIEPAKTTTINSRYNDIELGDKLPLITAPMDTVVDLTNFTNFYDRGVITILPRTINFIEAYNRLTEYSVLRKNIDNGEMRISFPHIENIFFSFGIGECEEACEKHPTKIEDIKNLLLDIANGHLEKIIDICKKVKSINPTINIMVGNIANPETYEWYCEHSEYVDYVRCGIGAGGGCLTAKNSGISYPMASLIHETKEVKNEMEDLYSDKDLPLIVADGGMKDYADIVKALALGADYVMLGSIFNKALESCAPTYHCDEEITSEEAKRLFENNEPIYKYFRGMSTKSAQKAMGKTKLKTSEGVERIRQVEYTLDKWLENFEHYLRNAMSYSNARTLDEFIGKASIIQITRNAYARFDK